MADGELKGSGEVWNGKFVLGSIEYGNGAIASVDKDQFFVGVNQPAHVVWCVASRQSNSGENFVNDAPKYFDISLTNQREAQFQFGLFLSQQLAQSLARKESKLL